MTDDVADRCADVYREKTVADIMAGKEPKPVSYYMKLALRALRPGDELPGGVVVVPKEATDKQHDAARDWSRKKYGMPIGLDASAGCWSAMIAAAKEGKDGNR